MGTARPNRVVRWLVVGCACAVLLLPGERVSAQKRLAGDLFSWLFDAPRWNFNVHGGWGGYGRFLLQNPTQDPFDFRQRSLRGKDAFTIGAGIGATPLPRVGFRFSYQYTTGNLEWRDDTGTGTELLDSGEIADIRQHMLGFELIRYLLLETSRISPYATGGFTGSWWKMQPEGTLALRAPDSSTQFRWGAMGTIGLHYMFTQAFRVRLEVAGASIGNPFTGRDSFIALNGRTIDEPTRVRKTDLRLALQYSWGKPTSPATTDDKGAR